MRVFLWPREKSERKTLNIEVWIQISFYQQSVNKSWNSPGARHFTDLIPVAQWHISMSVMFQIFETTPCNNKDRNHCLWCHMGQQDKRERHMTKASGMQWWHTCSNSAGTCHNLSELFFSGWLHLHSSAGSCLFCLFVFCYLIKTSLVYLWNR